jgi:hypothetical protein
MNASFEVQSIGTYGLLTVASDTVVVPFSKPQLGADSGRREFPAVRAQRRVAARELRRDGRRFVCRAEKIDGAMLNGNRADGETTMKSIRGSGLKALTMTLVVGALLAYLSIQTPEPPGRVPGPEGPSPDSETSEFIASGGLVPDSAPPLAVEDGESNHTAVTTPASIDHPGLREAAQLEQMMPVTAVAGQARSVEAKYGVSFTRAQPRRQPPETGPLHGAAR